MSEIQNESQENESSLKPAEVSPRLRFSSIPSGSLSLGEARVALINHVLAKKRGGTLILRIDDTHPDKTTPEALQAFYDDLKWLGVTWQEGPDVGGVYGPYKKSERDSLYQKYLQQLVQEGKAYPCYCAPEKLEDERLRFLSAGKAPRYSGHCRDLNLEKRSEFETQGIKPMIRLKVDRQILKFRDAIYGDFVVDSDSIGDWVLGLADGRLTASFVTVIDDATMKITKVIRGENELSQSATQMLLYRALGWEVPAYAHIPLILGPDRTLLSKKHGISQVADLKAEGYLVSAVLHYLFQLGSTVPEGRKMPKVEEVMDRFSLEKTTRSSPIFDLDELKRIHAHYLKQLSDSDFFEACQKYVPHYSEIVASQGEDWLKANLLILREKCRTFSEIGEYLGYFLKSEDANSEEAKKALSLKDASRLLKLMTEELSQTETLDLETIHRLMENAKQKLKSKSKNVFSPLQVALTGHPHGPDLALIASLLGKEECLKRIDHVLTTLQHPQPK